ncbi:MAG: hypothetical protein IJP95_05515 [Bacteroidales bacterium]|nr:hypothetical protein [Bacteroidales bacterium]
MDCNTFTKLWLNSQDDNLPPEVQEHLAQCTRCRQKVESYNQALSMLKSEPEINNIGYKMEFAVMSRIENSASIAPQSTSYRKMWIASAVAGVAILVAAGIIYNQHRTVQEENNAIVDMISQIHDEQGHQSQQTSSYSDLAMLETLISANNQ